MERVGLATIDGHQPHRTVYDAWQRAVEPRVSEVIIISMVIKICTSCDEKYQFLDQSHDST